MPVITRQLTFLTENLGKAADLVLTFGEPDHSGDLVVCKAFHFPAFGISKATFTFRSQFAFFCASVSGGTVIPTTFVAIELGEQVKLVQEGGIDSFTSPEQGGAPNQLTAVNETGRVVGLGLGFIADGGRVVPMYYWDHVGNSTRVVVEPSYVLRGYVASQYKEGEIIRSHIGAPSVLEANLLKLSEYTIWNLFYNPVTGTFELRLK